MALRNRDQIRSTFEAFIEARSHLLDAAYDACVEKGVYPNMRNMWDVALRELFGPSAGEKAMDLSAGLNQITQDYLAYAKPGVQVEDGPKPE